MKGQFKKYANYILHMHAHDACVAYAKLPHSHKSRVTRYRVMAILTFMKVIQYSNSKHRSMYYIATHFGIYRQLQNPVLLGFTTTNTQWLPCYIVCQNHAAKDKN